MKVHRELGPGLLESTYEACFALELSKAGLSFQRQAPIAVSYLGLQIDCAYRADFIIERMVIVELKSVSKIDPIHIAQVLTYLKLSGCRTALLINFNVRFMPDGIKRLVL
jgi:GxxExxY protein